MSACECVRVIDIGSERVKEGGLEVVGYNNEREVCVNVSAKERERKIYTVRQIDR